MEWHDTGCLLAVQPFGEGHALAELLTSTHGRTRALVYGGSGRKMSRLLQQGNQFSVRWYARLEEQMGTFTLDPLRSRTAYIMAKRENILALRSMNALLVRYLPEREAHPVLYTATQNVLDAFCAEDSTAWRMSYALWEVTLLSELGYGLDISQCAVTGTTTDLAYVSPKTGRAVCRDIGLPYKEKLLALPDIFLTNRSSVSWADLFQTLTLSGFFLNRRIAEATGDKELPSSRQQLLHLINSKL